MSTPAEKAARFRALHEREEIFIMPNPWDIGSTKILTKMGFEALATTSAGFCFTITPKPQNPKTPSHDLIKLG